MRIRQLLVAGVVALALVGCSPNMGFEIFDREPTAEDVLPEYFTDFDGEHEYDLDSVRYAASYEGIDLYLLRWKPGGVCIVIAAEENSGTACGGSGSVTTSSPAGTFELAPAPIPEKDGWTVIADNIRVRDE